MLVVVGGRASGKRAYVNGLGYGEADIADGCLDDRPVLINLQDLVAELPESQTPEEIARLVSDREVVTCCEVGNGIVPLDPVERAWRERVGRTLNILAEKADSVVRMVCGIPVTLK